MTSRIHTPQPQSGFTLVELMIAMVLSLLLAIAIGTLFLANKRSYRQNSLVAEMQSNGRFAMHSLSQDLAMAGYFGGMTAPPQPGKSLDDRKTSWVFNEAALQFINDVDTNSQTGQIVAAIGNTIRNGSDIVVVRHAAGNADLVCDHDQQNSPCDTSKLAPDTVYLATNRTSGTLFLSGNAKDKIPKTVKPDAGEVSYYRYISDIYYIGCTTDSAQANACIPSLCRVYLGARQGATPQHECIAQGIQNLQIAFGIDTSGNKTVNRYVINPGPGTLKQTVTARIQILARSVNPDYTYVNDKKYNLAGYDDDGDGAIDDNDEGVSYGDHYYRRIMQTTVQLNNQSLHKPPLPDKS